MVRALELFIITLVLWSQLWWNNSAVRNNGRIRKRKTQGITDDSRRNWYSGNTRVKQRELALVPGRKSIDRKTGAVNNQSGSETNQGLFRKIMQ